MGWCWCDLKPLLRSPPCRTRQIPREMHENAMDYRSLCRNGAGVSTLERRARVRRPLLPFQACAASIVPAMQNPNRSLHFQSVKHALERRTVSIHVSAFGSVVHCCVPRTETSMGTKMEETVSASTIRVGRRRPCRHSRREIEAKRALGSERNAKRTVKGKKNTCTMRNGGPTPAWPW